jgi:hypothetical protein
VGQIRTINFHASKRIRLCVGKKAIINNHLEFSLADFISGKNRACALFRFWHLHTPVGFFVNFFFKTTKKNSPRSCTSYTKGFTFVAPKTEEAETIWFYLVRAEVVLWWHCLFFLRDKRSDKT